MTSSTTLTHQDYTVGWICALPVELATARGMFNETHSQLQQDPRDNNSYALGRIGVHNVVLACLPCGVTGLTSAARVASDMLYSFQGLRVGLMVGIGGGVPSQEHDIRLGDVVVSKPTGTSGGVIQYDFGKTVQEGRFRCTGSLDRPPDVLLTALSNLESKHIIEEPDLLMYLREFTTRYPKFAHPGQHKDQLYEASYDHVGDNPTCETCDASKLVCRAPRNPDTPLIHFGIIASGNGVMRHGGTRDRLRKEHDVLCFEMEAAGLMDRFPALVIRGICDYADSHKNKRWQPYAAATAAAFAKELLSFIPQEKVTVTRAVTDMNETEHLNLVKPIFSVPFKQDPKFVGREDVISQIKERLPDQSLVSISGVGGVGKSQIAIEYAYRFHQDNPEAHVFWVYAASADRFDQAYKDVAAKLRLPRRDDPNTDVCKLVFDWLNQDGRNHWLMILDNADDRELFFSSTDPIPSTRNIDKTTKLLLDYIPQNLDPKRSIIVTTRNSQLGKDLASGEPPIEVLPFSRDDANILLQSKKRAATESQNGPDAERLLEVLGYIPLAISQAAAFMARNRMSVQQYLNALKRDEQNLTDHLSVELYDPRRERGTPNSIFRTWSLSFNQIREREPLAAEILSLSAMLDRQQIPEMLLRRNERDTDFSTAVGTLLGLSLITKEIGEMTFSMHRLVQLSVYAWLEQHDQKFHYMEEALGLLRDRFPADRCRSDYKRACESIYPHAQAVLHHRYYPEASRITQSYLLYNTSRFDLFQGRYASAHEKASQAHQIYVELLGQDDTRTLNSLSVVGVIVRAQGNYKMAESIFRQVLDKFKKALGTESTSTLSSMDHLASTLRYQKKYKEAEDLSRQAVDGYEKALGKENPKTWATVNNLALILERQGDYRAAEEMYQKVVKSKERILGSEHLDTLSSVHNLAWTFGIQRKYNEAEELFQRAINGKEKILGTEHPETLSIVHNLAWTLRKQEKYSEAEELFQRVMRESEKVLGSEHPETLSSVHGLALTYGSQEKYNEAEELYQRAISGSEKVLGPEHPDTLSSVHELAWTYGSQEKYNEAEELYQRAISGREKVLGPEHPETLSSVHELAWIYGSQEKYNEAEELYQRAISGSEKVLGSEHPDTLSSVHELAWIYGSQEKYSEAEKLYQRAISGSEKVLGLEHLDTIESIRGLARLYDIQGKYHAASPLYQRALAGFRGKLGSDHPDTIQVSEYCSKMLEAWKGGAAEDQESVERGTGA